MSALVGVEGRTVRFVVMGAPRLQADVANRYVRSKERKQWREAVVYAARCAAWMEWMDPFERATVRFDCYRSGQEPDADNLRISCKSLLDGLQPRTVTYRKGATAVGIGCGLIRSDKPDCIGTPEVVWHKCKRGDERVEISVTERG